MRSSKMSLKSKNIIFGFLAFAIRYCLSFNLVRTPQRLGNWFQRYKRLKDPTNNKKQKKLSALFGCILKTVFASSDSFCLITSHMWLVLSLSDRCHNYEIWVAIIIACLKDYALKHLFSGLNPIIHVICRFSDLWVISLLGQFICCKMIFKISRFTYFSKLD